MPKNIDTAAIEAIQLMARAKPFTSEPVGEYRFSVESDGTVRVWDSVAGHYTLCHSLTSRSARRIANIARAGRS